MSIQRKVRLVQGPLHQNRVLRKLCELQHIVRPDGAGGQLIQRPAEVGQIKRILLNVVLKGRRRQAPCL